MRSGAEAAAGECDPDWFGGCSARSCCCWLFAGRPGVAAAMSRGSAAAVGLSGPPARCCRGVGPGFVRVSALPVSECGDDYFDGVFDAGEVYGGGVDAARAAWFGFFAVEDRRVRHRFQGAVNQAMQ